MYIFLTSHILSNCISKLKRYAFILGILIASNSWGTPKTVVLDLDGVLGDPIPRSKADTSDLSVVEFQGSYFQFAPAASELIQYLLSYPELTTAIFSSADLKYIKAILEQLSLRSGADAFTMLSQNIYTSKDLNQGKKDLSVMTDLSNTLLVDDKDNNTPRSQIHNQIWMVPMELGPHYSVYTKDDFTNKWKTFAPDQTYEKSELRQVYLADRNRIFYIAGILSLILEEADAKGISLIEAKAIVMNRYGPIHSDTITSPSIYKIGLKRLRTVNPKLKWIGTPLCSRILDMK